MFVQRGKKNGLFVATWIDYLILEAAMSLYEFLDLLFSAIPILIDLIQRLLRRRKKKRKNKKIARQR